MELKTNFAREMEGWKEVVEEFPTSHPQISVRTPEGLSLSRARGFTPESVAQFLKSTNPQWTPFNIILQDFTTVAKLASLLYSTNT